MRSGRVLTQLKRLLVGCLLAYVAVAAIMFMFQRSLMYFPDGAPPDPASLGLEARTVTMQTADGLSLAAWYLPPSAGRPVVVLFHGNAGSRANLAGRVRLYGAAGYGALAMDYRGYGGNPGSPDEAGLMADARAALAFVRGQGVAQDRIIYHGESLGTGVAVALAAETPPAALVLESPYLSVPEVAKEQWGWLPVDLLVRDRFASIERIGGIRTPTLILHGALDSLIPVAQGQALFSASGSAAKSFRLLPDAAHGNLYHHGAGPIIATWLDGQFAR